MDLTILTQLIRAGHRAVAGARSHAEYVAAAAALHAVRRHLAVVRRGGR